MTYGRQVEPDERAHSLFSQGAPIGSRTPPSEETVCG